MKMKFIMVYGLCFFSLAARADEHGVNKESVSRDPAGLVSVLNGKGDVGCPFCRTSVNHELNLDTNQSPVANAGDSSGTKAIGQ